MRWLFAVTVVALAGTSPVAADPLPGTAPLTSQRDPAAAMVAGMHRYLDRELAASVEKRKQFWKPDFSSPEAYAKSVQPNRERLKTILGVVDQRLPPAMELIATTDQPSLVAETERYKVHAVRWPVLPGVDAEGLLLEPTGKPVACVVVVPDADQTPGRLAGIGPGPIWDRHIARRLAEGGCRVLVPTLIDRKNDYSGNPRLNKRTNQPHREFVYRMAYEMGRHVIGYEVQKVLAAVDWFKRDPASAPVGVYGVGEGGLVALMAAAVDERIAAAHVQNYALEFVSPAEEPIYRNVWAIRSEFGRHGLYLLTLSRPVSFDNAPVGLPRGQSAGSRSVFFGLKQNLLQPPASEPIPAASWATESPAARQFSESLFRAGASKSEEAPLTDRRPHFDPAARQKRQFDQLVAYTQKLWRDSEAVRNSFFWKRANLSSPEAWQKSCEPMRAYFWEEVIGKLPPPTLPPNPRTRQLYDEPKWAGHEVMLDLYPDVFAYGILLTPKDLKPGERRPVVVCQHGLEGTPRSCIDAEKRTTYNRFAARLADLGYVVYCPQNPYVGEDKFRQLQRKANPLKLSLFSFIVRQHETTLDWLATLPFVDADRIAFYGLSYGGKTAMRVPALLPRYCLSICSGDFNEWVGKCMSVDLDRSYMYTREYDMYEFDLGHTFNYAEMAGLIAPRPFMVERGHDDGVGIDEMVAYEYAKVRRLYSKLGIPERTAIEFFPGGHQINAKGTFAFLKQHLKWPK